MCIGTAMGGPTMTRMARGAAVLFATVALAAGVFVSGAKAAPPLCGSRQCAEEIDAACGGLSGAAFRACKSAVVTQCKISGETFCSCTNPALPPCPPPPTTTTSSSTTTTTSSTTTTTASTVCGDGVIQAGEECDGASLGVCSECRPAGFPSSCQCCLDGGPGVQIVGCCNPWSILVPAPNSGGTCVATRCDPPFSCTGNDVCQPDGTCCTPVRETCLITVILPPIALNACCPGLECRGPDSSGAGIGCCVPDGGTCAADAECCSQHCGTSGTCDACRGGGGSCTNPAECCSLSCTGGACDACAGLGAPCLSSAACCSGACNPSTLTCVASTTSSSTTSTTTTTTTTTTLFCAPDGTYFGGVPGFPCCSGGVCAPIGPSACACGPGCEAGPFPTCGGPCYLSSPPQPLLGCIPSRIITATGTSDSCTCLPADLTCDPPCPCPAGQVCQFDFTTFVCGCVPL
jgi:hypothetical protein